MTDSKTQQYIRQGQDAKRSILLEWPSYQRTASREASARFRRGQPLTSEEHLKDAVEIVLEVARMYRPRGKGPHTPLGHDCEVCEAMRTVIEWLATGDLPPVDMT